MQLWVGSHAVVQLPQWTSLVITLAQTPSHTISPDWHIGSAGLSGVTASIG
ncbi:MAG TPA: hypothetical protein VFV99_29870 [Kofleriaceae bacterium]|nr:hypothetical protein [Kofleriaceae bacterium]